MAFTRATHSGQWGMESLTSVPHSSRSSQICPQCSGKTILAISAQNLGISCMHTAGSPDEGQTSVVSTDTMAAIEVGVTENMARSWLALAQSSHSQSQEPRLVRSRVVNTYGKIHSGHSKLLFKNNTPS